MNGRGSGGSDGVSLSVSPEEPLLDEVIDVRVTGLSPGERVTLRVETTWHDAEFASRATFEADDEGVVDPAEAAPVAGDYERRDPMGPFVSLSAPDPPERPDLPRRLPTTVAVEREGERVASERIDRVGRPDGVERLSVEAAGVPADLYAPAGEGPHPGVVLLGGSGGGRPRMPRAWLLAAHGYAVLGPAYFGAEGSPAETLTEVSVEEVADAVAWFADHEGVRVPLATVGVSRGSELGFVLASRLEAVRTAVGYVPSGVVFEGLGEKFQPAGTAALAVDGEPLDYVPMENSFRDLLGMAWSLVAGRPHEIAGVYVDGIEAADDDRVRAAEIPVEDVDGPVLLIAGEDDRLWRSAALSRRLRDRLVEAGHGDVTLRSYAEAGHAIGAPYLPTTNRAVASAGRFGMALGGTPAGYAAADRDSWEAVLATLDRGIGGPDAAATGDGPDGDESVGEDE